MPATPGRRGPQGPPGPPGPGGAGGLRYEHDQAVAATEWVVAHGFGVRPAAVMVIDTAGSEVKGQVRHDSTLQLTLLFSAPFSGKALVTG